MVLGPPSLICDLVLAAEWNVLYGPDAYICRLLELGETISYFWFRFVEARALFIDFVASRLSSYDGSILFLDLLSEWNPV